MKSGIYTLTFSDGSVYVGKSVDIPKRWAQHTKAMQKGTHTSKIQDVYNKYGVPEYDVIFECHPDHIDILETYFINSYWDDKILNTTRPADIDDLGKEILHNFPDFVWDLSTFDHILKWNHFEGKYKESVAFIKKSKDASHLEFMSEQVEILTRELERMRSRGFFARLFNWY